MNQAAQQLSEGKSKVAGGFNELIQGAEDMLRTATSYSGEGLDVVRQKFQSQVETLKELATSLEDTAAEKYKLVSETTNGYVRENPWRAVGIAALAGALVGALVARR